MKQNKSPFKRRHFEPTVTLLCVSRYRRYSLSYRDLEEMMLGRGLSVDHTTVWRWVQHYAPEINKRMRPHLKMSGTSYRLDETYMKVGTELKHLYRAVDSAGSTIEFMLSAKRDVSAAKRFFKKMLRAGHRRLPFTVGTDKHASYPEAFTAEGAPLRLKTPARQVLQQRDRARPPRGQTEVASDAMLSFFPHGRADAGGDRVNAHAEEGAG